MQFRPMSVMISGIMSRMKLETDSLMIFTFFREGKDSMATLSNLDLKHLLANNFLNIFFMQAHILPNSSFSESPLSTLLLLNFFTISIIFYDFCSIYSLGLPPLSKSSPFTPLLMIQSITFITNDSGFSYPF